MVGEMENYKVRVNNWDESKEVQELYIALGATCYLPNIASKWVCLYNKRITFYDLLPNVELKQLTLQELRDLVVLKRNDGNDANFKDTFGDIWYVDSTNSYWMFENDIWREAEEPLFKLELIEKPIKKEGEVKMKEYLDTNYELRSVKQTSGETPIPKGWIEVPEGAEIAVQGAGCKEVVFYKDNGEYQFDNKWIECGFDNGVIHHNLKFFLDFDKRNRIVWQRLDSKRETAKELSTQEKLKFIEKWLNGEKIQYILGVESEKTQWHNFTEGAMQYIKRSDIKFREAPKYVTINGIEFKSVESLLKHVKNNFDLEDGE